ncbi:IS3 family transposase [Nitrosomonas sp.]|uniref:IS3 family transposase n=1 Tax=Nitrosomonas sp. TaxID=42353 RepID=UPI0035217068
MGRETCRKNSPTERFLSCLKRGWLISICFIKPETAIADIHAYIGYYNTQRIHVKIFDMTPIEFEKGLS